MNGLTPSTAINNIISAYTNREGLCQCANLVQQLHPKLLGGPSVDSLRRLLRLVFLSSPMLITAHPQRPLRVPIGTSETCPLGSHTESQRHPISCTHVELVGTGGVE